MFRNDCTLYFHHRSRNVRKGGSWPPITIGHSIDPCSWESARFLASSRVLDSWSVVNVNRSELGSVDNIAEWGSSRLKRAEKVQSRMEGKERGKIKKNEEKERKRTPQERANEMKTGGEREGDRLFLNLNRKTMVKRRGRRWGVREEREKRKKKAQLSRTLKELWQIYEHVTLSLSLSLACAYLLRPINSTGHSLSPRRPLSPFL